MTFEPKVLHMKVNNVLSTSVYRFARIFQPGNDVCRIQADPQMGIADGLDYRQKIGS